MTRLCALVFLTVVWACNEQSILPPEQALPIHDLEFPAAIRIDGGRVLTAAPESFSIILDISNTSSDRVDLRRGKCFARLRAYSEPTLDEPAIWDDRRIEGWFCADVAAFHSLGPGESASLASDFSTQTIVSWPPPSTSHLGMVLVVNGERLMIPVDNDWR